VYNEILYTNILRLLDELGISKTVLAERSGVSVSFLSDLTNGHANPSLETMERIAAALDTPLPALLEMSDLSREDMEFLTAGKQLSALPDGFVRMTAIFTEFQAYKAKQWDVENRRRIYGPAKDR